MNLQTDNNQSIELESIEERVPAGYVSIQKIDAKTGEVVEEIYNNNRLVIRYHVVLTHLLSPVGNLSNNLSGDALLQLGIPTSEDLKITKMRFGTDGTQTSITMSGVLAVVPPLFNADGTTIPVQDNIDFYTIDTYRYSNGADVNGIPDYDQAITFEATMAGPQGNGTTIDPVIYREAGLFTQNDIMFARVTLPNLTKDENFAFKFSWTVRFP